MMPAGRMISWSASALIGVSSSSTLARVTGRRTAQRDPRMRSGDQGTRPARGCRRAGRRECSKAQAPSPDEPPAAWTAACLPTIARPWRRETEPAPVAALSCLDRDGARLPPGPESSPTPRERRGVGCLVELVETVVLTAIIFFVLQSFVAQPFQVQQVSMRDTIEDGQYVLVDKLTPRFDGYHRGDIIVFTPPAANAETQAGKPYIKRIIGVAGDRVAIDDGHVFVNGIELDEPYLFADDGAPQPTTPHDRAVDLDRPRRRAVRHGRPPRALVGLPRLRPDRARFRRRAGVAAVLADRHDRDPADRRPPSSWQGRPRRRHPEGGTIPAPILPDL